MIKKLLLATVQLTTLVGVARAAEKFEASALHITAETPDGCVKAPELPKADGFIGDAKGLYVSPDIATNGAAMLVHSMPVPAGLDYAGFKSNFANLLGQFLPTSKVIKQEDVKVGKLDGFSLEFTCPGDGGKPDPNGTIPHHIRWYFFKDGEAKMIGVLYGSRDAAWKDLDSKYQASFKTLKQTN